MLNGAQSLRILLLITLAAPMANASKLKKQQKTVAKPPTRLERIQSKEIELVKRKSPIGIHTNPHDSAARSALKDSLVKTVDLLNTTEQKLGAVEKTLKELEQDAKSSNPPGPEKRGSQYWLTLPNTPNNFLLTKRLTTLAEEKKFTLA